MTDIIIVLTTEGDPSSSEVIHWMNRLGGKVIRINSLLDLQNFVLEHPDAMSLDASISRCDRTLIRGIWYRRHPALLSPIAITNTSSDIEMDKFFISEQKAFFDAFCKLHKDNKWLNTTICTREMIDQLNDTFFPCLCQKFIDKNLKIRAFFLDGKIYSMGICSTSDEQTKIDFRRYNRKHPQPGDSI